MNHRESYKNIFIPIDSSPHAHGASDIALQLADLWNAHVTACHVYAAGIHDLRFRHMERGLPSRYLTEEKLEYQREVHGSLISQGLELISNSHLRQIEENCRMRAIPLTSRSLEGRNFAVLIKEIEENNYDLVIMGALGLGVVAESDIGSVCERVTRRIRKDIWIVKNCVPEKEKGILVTIDGSAQSFGGLKRAMSIGKALNMRIEAISVYDPFFHTNVFQSLKQTLSQEKDQLFRLQEQERLHEEIVDSGLARIYQTHLEIARRVAEQEGLSIQTTLLAGKPFQTILHYSKKHNPWLLVLGRFGIHSERINRSSNGYLDLGSTTENLLRLSNCNILLSNSAFSPPLQTMAREAIVWTKEAEARTQRIPLPMRNMVRTAILQYAMKKGHSVINSSLIDRVMEIALPHTVGKPTIP